MVNSLSIAPSHWVLLPHHAIRVSGVLVDLWGVCLALGVGCVGAASLATAIPFLALPAWVALPLAGAMVAIFTLRTLVIALGWRPLMGIDSGAGLRQLQVPKFLGWRRVTIAAESTVTIHATLVKVRARWGVMRFSSVHMGIVVTDGERQIATAGFSGANPRAEWRAWCAEQQEAMPNVVVRFTDSSAN